MMDCLNTHALNSEHVFTSSNYKYRFAIKIDINILLLTLIDATFYSSVNVRCFALLHSNDSNLI